MKKRVIFSFTLILFLVFAMSGNVVEAGFSMSTPHGQIVPYSGVSYNSLNMEKLEGLFVETYAEIDKVDETDSTPGFYLGANHWFKDKLSDYGAGFEYEELIAIKYDRPNVELENRSLFLTGSYRLSGIKESLPEYIYFTTGIGVSQAVLTWKDDEVLEADYDKPVYDGESFIGPALKIGVQGSYTVYKNVKLGGRANYRYARPHSEGDLDINGFELGAQVEIKF